MRSFLQLPCNNAPAVPEHHSRASVRLLQSSWNKITDWVVKHSKAGISYLQLPTSYSGNKKSHKYGYTLLYLQRNSTHGLHDIMPAWEATHTIRKSRKKVQEFAYERKKFIYLHCSSVKWRTMEICSAYWERPPCVVTNGGTHTYKGVFLTLWFWHPENLANSMSVKNKATGTPLDV